MPRHRAVAAHASWKRRLREAIDTGSSDVTVSTAARDNVCEFGKWLMKAGGGEFNAASGALTREMMAWQWAA